MLPTIKASSLLREAKLAMLRGEKDLAKMYLLATVVEIDATTKQGGAYLEH